MTQGEPNEGIIIVCEGDRDAKGNCVVLHGGLKGNESELLIGQIDVEPNQTLLHFKQVESKVR